MNFLNIMTSVRTICEIVGTRQEVHAAQIQRGTIYSIIQRSFRIELEPFQQCFVKK